METPNSRFSDHNRDGYNTPVDSQRTLSDKGDNAGGTDKRGSGVLVVYPKNNDQDRICRVEGKAHKSKASKLEWKRKKDLALGRKMGNLSIQEQSDGKEIAHALTSSAPSAEEPAPTKSPEGNIM